MLHAISGRFMADDYDEHKELAQQNLSLMIRQLGVVGQNNLAAYLGLSDAKVSDMKNKEFPMMAKALAFLMMRVDHKDNRTFTEEQIRKFDFLAELGREYLLKHPRMSDIR
jgi:hypothetical protein